MKNTLINQQKEIINKIVDLTIEEKVDLNAELKSRSDFMKELLLQYADYDITGFQFGYDNKPELTLKVNLRQFATIILNGNFEEMDGFSNYARLRNDNYSLSINLPRKF